jgi:hypothetical protein
MGWLKLSATLRHAFAVEPPGAAAPTEPQREVIERVCQELVRRQLTTPALIFIQMSKPLNYVASQAMLFFSPIVAIVTDAQGYDHFATFLEQRGSVEYLCLRLEAIEAARAAARGNAGPATQPRQHMSAGES